MRSFAVLALVACGDNAAPITASPDAGATTLYAVTTTVFDESSASTYVALVDSLDDRQISLAQAREFPGWSSVAARGNVLYVGDGERPEVARFTVDDRGQLGEAEQRVSFAAYGLTSGSLWHNTFVDGEMAHMTLEETSRIRWNPTEMTIIDAAPASSVPLERDGMDVSASNSEGRRVRTDGVFESYFWHDVDWYGFHQQSQIAVFSRDGQLVKQLDVPCPALQVATQDEAGNLYYSGMVDTIGYQLHEPGNTLERCVVRIDAGTQTIAAGWPRRFEELTGGRPAGRFYYMRDGIGILTVYHTENVDPTSDTFLDDWYRSDWGLWLVDLETWQARRIESWPLGSSNVFFSQLDDRLFLHDVAGDFSSTVIYEIGIDGTHTKRVTVPGYAADPLLRLR